MEQLLGLRWWIAAASKCQSGPALLLATRVEIPVCEDREGTRGRRLMQATLLECAGLMKNPDDVEPCEYESASMSRRVGVGSWRNLPVSDAG